MEIICMGPEIWTKCMDPKKKDIFVDGKICCTNSKRAMVVG